MIGENGGQPGTQANGQTYHKQAQTSRCIMNAPAAWGTPQMLATNTHARQWRCCSTHQARSKLPQTLNGVRCKIIEMHAANCLRIGEIWPKGFEYPETKPTQEGVVACIASREAWYKLNRTRDRLVDLSAMP